MLGLTVVLMGAQSGAVRATGFFINQQSVRGLGRVNAGSTVAADELGTIFFNPAGLPTALQRPPEDRKRFRVAFGTHLIVPRSHQVNRNSVVSTPGTLGAPVHINGGDADDPTNPTPVPNLYGAVRFGDRAALGVGINAPFGLSTDFDRGWHGRYDATAAALSTYNASVVAAYRFDSGMSVGGGLDLQHARSKLTTAVPNPLAPGGPTPATDGLSRTVGNNAITLGFNVGILYELDNGTRIGAHYRSGMTHVVNGTSETTGLSGPLASFNGFVDARAELRMPAIASTAIRVPVTPSVAVLAEVQWFDWSTFQEVRIRFADGRADGVRRSNFRDALGVAGGVEYLVGPRWTARGGIRKDTTPTRDGFRDTTVPDSSRLWLGAGASFEVSERVRLDLAFNHVFFEDTVVDTTRTFFAGTPLATSVTLDSLASSVVNTVAIDCRLRF
jgi:long-chain fatty acid transport protein